MSEKLLSKSSSNGSSGFQREPNHWRLLEEFNKMLDEYRAAHGRQISQMEVHDLFYIAAHHYWPDKMGEVGASGIDIYLGW